MRILFIVLVLKLCYFHLFYCDGICSYESWELYLLQTDDDTHRELNKIFLSKMLPFKHRCKPTNVYLQFLDENSLIDILTMHQHFGSEANRTAVIHLYAKEFYNTNYNFVLEHNFVFAGDIGTEETIEVCRSVISNDSNYDETCQKSYETQSIAKLVSKNLQMNPTLFEAVTNFDGLPLTIGICGYNDTLPLQYSNIQPFLEPVKLEIKTEYTCEGLKTERMIAILTPKPFTPEEKLWTTTIFYDHVHASPETNDLLPNSLPLVQSTDKLKFAFLKFMRMRNWNRVAIISDDSLISAKFRQELSSLFENENIIFVTKTCEISNCDFTEILNYLKMHEAKVIIANIAEEYVWKLAVQAVELNAVKVGLVWIFRSDLVSPAILAEVAKRAGIGDIYSIALGPSLPHCYSNPCNILAPLNAIKEVLKKHVIDPKQLFNVNYRRSITTRIKRILYRSDSFKAYVKWYPKNSNRLQSPRLAAEMDISPDNTVKYQALVDLPHYRPELDYCTFKSNVYSKPCSDEEAIFIMMVVSVFVLTLLGIVLFFQSFEISYTRINC